MQLSKNGKKLVERFVDLSHPASSLSVLSHLPKRVISWGSSLIELWLLSWELRLLLSLGERAICILAHGLWVSHEGVTAALHLRCKWVLSLHLLLLHHHVSLELLAHHLLHLHHHHVLGLLLLVTHWVWDELGLGCLLLLLLGSWLRRHLHRS